MLASLAACTRAPSGGDDADRGGAATQADPAVVRLPPDLEQRVLANVTASGGSAYVDPKRTIASDVDGDGGLDYGFIAVHEHENTVDELIGLAASNGGLATTDVYGSVEGLVASKGGLEVRVNSYAPDDGQCCPSGHMKLRYSSAQGQLKRVPEDYTQAQVFIDALHAAGIRCTNRGKSEIAPDLFGSIDHAICVDARLNVQILIFADDAAAASGLADAAANTDISLEGGERFVLTGSRWLIRINGTRSVASTIEEITGRQARPARS